MPKYVFECETCTVRFERFLKMGENTLHACPSCGDDAPQVIDGFSFSFAQGGGAPGNSGVHDHDYPTADKAVGRSADERWNHYNEREKAKAEARKQGGTHALMRVNGPDYVEYRPMSPQGREARRKLAHEALNKVREAKSRPVGG
jgi:putative FmdB family regulatory protein